VLLVGDVSMTLSTVSAVWFLVSRSCTIVLLYIHFFRSLFFKSIVTMHGYRPLRLALGRLKLRSFTDDAQGDRRYIIIQHHGGDLFSVYCLAQVMDGIGR